MKNELRYIGEKIVENHIHLAKTVDLILGPSFLKHFDISGLNINEREDYRGRLIRLFGEALYKEIEGIQPKVIDWGVSAAKVAIEYNVSISDLLRIISVYRTVIWDVFTEELEQEQFAAITMLDVSKIIDPLFDEVSRVIGITYENHNKRLMELAYTRLEGLSVPVVPIIDGVAVIPLIGEVDTRRAKLIMETALQEGAQQNMSHLILDVSGVIMIDTMVAQQLFTIIKALKLIGVEAMITGIRPEIAQTIGSLGLDFSGIKTCANMQQALKQIGLQIVKT